jgi:hypothetical protein
MDKLRDNQALGEAALEKAIKKHFAKNQMPNFSEYFFNKIVSRLDYEKQLKTLKPRLWTAVGFFVTSFAMLVFAFTVSWHAFGQTGISKYFSLIFTDFGVVTANWQDYSLSLLDSLPLGATALLLGAFLGSILLIDYGSHQISNFRKLTSGGHYGNK